MRWGMWNQVSIICWVVDVVDGRRTVFFVLLCLGMGFFIWLIWRDCFHQEKSERSAVTSGILLNSFVLIHIECYAIFSNVICLFACF